MGGDISAAADELRAVGIPIIALNMVGSITEHVDLVVSDPCRPGRWRSWRSPTRRPSTSSVSAAGGTEARLALLTQRPAQPTAISSGSQNQRNDSKSVSTSSASAAGGGPRAAAGSARIRAASARYAASLPPARDDDGRGTAGRRARSGCRRATTAAPARPPRAATGQSPARSGTTACSRQPSRATSVTARDDVVEHSLADEVVEVHPDPAGLDALATAGDLALERMGRLDVDPEQAMAVRPGTRAAAARLDAEQVVEQRHDEVVMEIAVIVADRERHDRQARQRGVAEDLDHGSVRQAAMARSMNSSSRSRIASTPTRCLSWKARPARIDSTMAGVPPSSRCSGSAR